MYLWVYTVELYNFIISKKLYIQRPKISTAKELNVEEKKLFLSWIFAQNICILPCPVEDKGRILMDCKGPRICLMISNITGEFTDLT